MGDAKTIILIDSAASATSALAGRLRMQGYVVAIAQDPAHGARLALSEPPTAVVGRSLDAEHFRRSALPAAESRTSDRARSCDPAWAGRSAQSILGRTCWSKLLCR